MYKCTNKCMRIWGEIKYLKNGLNTPLHSNPAHKHTNDRTQSDTRINPRPRI